MLVAAVSLLLGITMGRYQVFAVMLASVLLIIVGAAEGYVNNRNIGMSLTLIVIYLVCLQFGYLASATAWGLYLRRKNQTVSQGERQEAAGRASKSNHI